MKCRILTKISVLNFPISEISKLNVLTFWSMGSSTEKNSSELTTISSLPQYS